MWTHLHEAATDGDVESMKLLLASPGLDVNLRSTRGCTPLFCACIRSRLDIVRLLLADPRVDVNIGDIDEWHAVWIACRFDSLAILQHLLACGKYLRCTKLGRYNGEWITPLQIARLSNSVRCLSLMRRILDDESRARYEVRVELGMLDVIVADLYALIIFWCDGLLAFSGRRPTISLGRQDIRVRRFFGMSKRLPIDLQMLLCHRIYGSPAQNVLTRDSEPAFRRLACYFPLSSI